MHVDDREPNRRNLTSPSLALTLLRILIEGLDMGSAITLRRCNNVWSRSRTRSRATVFIRDTFHGNY